MSVTNFTPIKWSAEEEAYAWQLKQSGLTLKLISECLNRGELQVAIKLKRLAKRNGVYNPKHLHLKQAKNTEFLALVNPKTILDVYAGVTSSYLASAPNGCRVVANDKLPSETNIYQEDAFKLMCNLSCLGCSYDLVDLDPFGSAYECFPLAFKMARRGLAITLGEMGHKRFKRLDYVERVYGVKTLEGFTSLNIVAKIVELARCYKVNLTPIFIEDWTNISRVYFTVAPLKIRVAGWVER
jgi:hypothetical protein